MGVGDLLLDPASDDLVNFLQKLARTRSIPTVLDYIVDGHVARPFVISPQAETRQQKVPSGKWRRRYIDNAIYYKCIIIPSSVFS